MTCDICGRGNCTESFHSLNEQERYEKVIDAFDKARELRAQVRAEIEAEEAEEAQEDDA
jgi:transcription elongation factor Elf1